MHRPGIIGILFPLTVLAQTATIEGLVTDPSGAAVPDASVVATLESTGTVRGVNTDEQGRYRILALTVGTYTIRCQKPGFQNAEVRRVALSLNQTLEQPFHLNLAEAGTSIDVHEQP